MIILGAGSWGTALAVHAAKCGHPVTIWGHDVPRTRELALRRVNATYLPGFRLPDSVRVDDRIDRAFSEGARYIVLVVPSHVARNVLEPCRPYVTRDTSVVIATKGIEVGTLSLMTVLSRTVGERSVVLITRSDGRSYQRSSCPIRTAKRAG